MEEGELMAIESVNPATGERIKTFDAISLKDAKKEVKKAHKAFLKWRMTSFSERKQLMLKAAEILKANKEQYAKLMTEEMGKPVREATSEVEKCAWACEFYAENAERFLKEEVVETDASRSYIRFDPLGVILAVMPWNFPFWQVFRFAAPALMAGNTGVLKHASNVPQCALAIEDVFKKAGFPDDVFKALLIDSKTTLKLVAMKEIKAVSLTGSEKAGQQIAAKAGRHLKKCVLELGGSDPFIVLEDAELDSAARSAVIARTLNTGQSCIAAKRFIVAEKVADAFVQKFKEQLEALKVGDPSEPGNNLGPLAREDLRAALDGQVKRAVEKGARIVTGGTVMDGKGCFYKPTILSNVRPGNPVFEEETFGPVAAIISVKDEKEAVKLANQSNYGLGASIWTKDKEKAERLAKEIESGAVFVNGVVKSDPRLPFGGIKQSGYGRELSAYGIKEFVNIKTVWVK